MLFISITRLESMQNLKYKSCGIELRLDLFHHIDMESIRDFLQDSSCPVMFTVRKTSQGGKFQGTEAEREAFIKQLLALEPSFFDLEYDMSPKFLHETIKEYPKTKFILSYHNFQEIPVDLDGIYRGMQEYAAFSYKIAVMARSTNDALKMLLFVKNHPKTSVICMGEKGEFARVLGPVAGNLIDYASVDSKEQTGPGQLTVSEFVDIYRYPFLNTHTSIYGLIGDPVEKSPGHIYHNGVFQNLYQEELNNREFGKKALPVFHSEPGAVFENTACSEDEKFERKQAPPKTDCLITSGVNLNAVYVKMGVEPGELSEFIRLAIAIGIRGLSVTIPLKERILPFLDEIEPSVKQIGAINTILFKNGRIIGANTDGLGALDAIEKRVLVHGKKVVLLGAGGAARSIAFEAKARGADVLVLNRTVQRAKELGADLGCRAGGLDEVPNDYDILINCSPDPMPIDPRKIRLNTLAMDIVYFPRETDFLKEASLKKCQIVYGEEMFLNQAALQTAFWMGA